ncbi:MAG: HDOD domain-containing protein [Pirellulaceae bacterium]
MKNVLFVDDDANVLAGLKRMLRPLRSEWSTEFVDSGERALAYMAEHPVDVIVTDMRMPGMDGVQLLEQVVARFPSAVRIALSGHSDQEMLIKVAGLAHQYLSKPCGTEDLKSTLCRSLALRDHCQNKNVDRLVSRLNSLPSLPTNYCEILQEFKSPEPSLCRVADIITRDAAMTAKVLQLVNSAFFGTARRVADPLHAVTLLGLQTVSCLVLSAGVFSQLDKVQIASFSANELIAHSIQVASLAKRIAALRTKDEALWGEAFVAGVLHDVGKLILASNFPRQYGEAATDALECGYSLCDLEREAFGADHAELGAYILGLWGIPSSLVEAVAFHHQPAKAQSTGFTALTAVHVANCLSHRDQDGQIPPGIDESYLHSIGVLNELPAWRRVAQSNIPTGILA